MADEYLSPEAIAAQGQISRQQQLANLLWQQGAQQPQGQMISGQYVKSSPLQFLSGIANQYVGNKTAEAATKAQADLAQKLRQQEMQDLQTYGMIQKGRPASEKELAGPAYQGVKPSIQYPAIQGNPEAADMFAASSYSPMLRAMGMKRITEGPKWEKAVMPMPDGSERHGWVNYNSANPKDTFVEGGVKPAFNALEGAKFTYETGMPVPTSAPQGQPIQGQPVRPQVAPVQSAPVQNAPVQVAPTANRAGVQPAAPMSAQVNAGNAVPVGATNRPAMSPKMQQEANKDVYVKSEQERQADLKALPNAINQAEYAIDTIQQMIGDARLDDKGNIVYKKYDPTSKKWVEGAEPHGGFEQYVGLGVPYLSNVEGTDTASFRSLYESLKGQAFLEAFQRIKGAGAITEVEGTKATQALLKLNKAQSEKEFIKYAREFQENLQKGMALAKQKAGVSQDYRSPVNQPQLRWNPQTNSWVQ
jgi:hypothetical protein